MTPTTAETVTWAWQVLKQAHLDHEPLSKSNFLDFADLVKDAVAAWPTRRKQLDPYLYAYLERLKFMRDEYEEIVAADPMINYRPAHEVALQFHKSQARYRYFRGGNGISKTQSGAADNYWVLTRQHPFRPLPPLGGSVFVVGVNFSKYAPAVFEAKYITGENGNPLSPAFPENGKWLHHYDPRKYIVTIACPECAEAGKPKGCPHIKPQLRLFSDVEGPDVLQGARYAQGQFDEQISYPFWAEAVKRIENVLNSGLIVTETPKFGKSWWTHGTLTMAAEGPSENNVIPETGQPIVSLHTIDQYSAGLVPKHEIDASVKLMTEAEYQCRVLGLPVAANEIAVFDLVTLANMRAECREPDRGNCWIKYVRDGKEIVEDPFDPERMTFKMLENVLSGEHPAFFVHEEEGPLRVWEKPDPTEQYIIGADVARGLTKGDYSSADVFKMTPIGFGIMLEQVAQYHAHINASFYGEDLMKLALYYNEAILAIERNGPGDTSIQKLKELAYWNLFRDVNDIAAARENFDQIYGIDTNVASKPQMISLLQSVIKDKATGRRQIILRSVDSLAELENYVQMPSASGKSFSFQSVGDRIHDDRVMSAAVAVYVTKAYDIYDYDLAKKLRMVKKLQSNDERTMKFWSGMDKRR